MGEVTVATPVGLYCVAAPVVVMVTSPLAPLEASAFNLTNTEVEATVPDVGDRLTEAAYPDPEERETS